MRILPVLTLAVAIAACVPQAKAPPPAPVLPPVPVPAPAPAPLGTDWRDWPVTPGIWRYDRDARGSIARFGVAGSDAALTLRCDLAPRRVYLSLVGGVATSVTIRTSSTDRALAMQPTGGVPPYVAATLAPNDPLLDAMGFSRGRFVVTRAGMAPLVIPAWAEIERVTEDCRG